MSPDSVASTRDDLQLPDTLRWDGERLTILDQRLLPARCEYLVLESLDDAWQAIHTLAVRGAPAIGIAAAYALAQSMLGHDGSAAEFTAQLQRNAARLKAARPTAVNLAWAVDRLVDAYGDSADPARLEAEATRIHAEDLEACEAIGRHGAPLIAAGSGVLTHCNAGSLAVSRLGTATAPMYQRHREGLSFRVYACETRPLYQGARLTAWELDKAGIDVTLICDNMAATTMAAGKVDLVLVGTDRVTANGDVVNKIGTLGLAVLCRHFAIPFYVACPLSTLDLATPSGAEVPIEERSAQEVRGEHAAQVPVFNPAFDVTPAELVSGIVTERGIFSPGELAAAMRS
ncbi:MAG: S-methyl-5-thioribose-1-phosphate isomerase [Halieaceae bacterium]|nr:S-methyl-5-thioribose-1-phosphate isomerase [Halieaceae bacterium]